MSFFYLTVSDPLLLELNLKEKPFNLSQSMLKTCNNLKCIFFIINIMLLWKKIKCNFSKAIQFGNSKTKIIDWCSYFN